MILWTHVACAHEESLPRDAHPQCDRSRAAYLQHLQTLGYVLSAVEQQIIDNTQPPADQPPTSRRPAAGRAAVGRAGAGRAGAGRAGSRPSGSRPSSSRPTRSQPSSRTRR